MDKQWVRWCALGLVLATGCGESAGNMPWSDPGPNDGVAGSAGEALAGSGGSAGDIAAPTGGMGGAGGAAGTGSVTACDPKPDAMDPETMDGGVIDDGSMGHPMDAGVVDEPVIDADGGTEPVPDVDPMLDAGVAEPTGPRAPNAGDLIITEVMMDPTVLGDSLGEWIEIHNGSTADLLLEGCVIHDDRNDDFVLGALTLPASGYLVLGRSDQAAALVDHVYSGMTLANTNDEIVITCNSVDIDRVAYGAGYARPAGKTMQLDATMLSATSNDLPMAWCAGTNQGTPGAANTSCAAP